MSEAYFARLLGLPFVAVMPAPTSPSKIALIEFQGGRCHLVDDAARIYAESRRIAAETGGHFMDQFTHAERATDWRGNNNIAESIFTQMASEPHPLPDWIVVGAGTGGTSATIGRYIRYRRHATRLCVVDPENSAFFDGWANDDPLVHHRPAVPNRGHRPPPRRASFMPAVIDRMIRVPDAASIAAMRFVRGDHRPHRRRLDRHQPLGRAVAGRRDARRRRARQHRHADLRPRRALPRHLLRRRLGRRPGLRTRPVLAQTLERCLASGEWHEP